MAALLWFLLALLLLAIAWLGPDLDGLLAAALAALGLSLLTAAAPALALMLALQGWSRRRRQRSIPASGSSERAHVISGFEHGEEAGRVRWQGQSWAAVHLEAAQALAPGSEVLVMGREGNRLQVLSAAADPERPEL